MMKVSTKIAIAALGVISALAVSVASQAAQGERLQKAAQNNPAVQQKVEQRQATMQQRAVHQCDMNADGMVDEQEKATCKTAAKTSATAKKDQAMQKIDTDGDGVISSTEKAAAQAAIDAQQEVAQQQMDLDGDGIVTADEAAAFKEAAAQ